MLENELGTGLVGQSTECDLISYKHKISLALPFVMI